MTQPQPAQDWTTPGVYPVADGVFRIPLPLPMDGLRAVNVYVLETEEGLVLIDGGWAIPVSRQLFDAGLAELGYSANDIREFLVTHMHRDHYTQAYVIGQETQASVWLGDGDRATMELMLNAELDHDPNLRRLQVAGAEHLAKEWREIMPSEPPSMDDYGMPDHWMVSDHMRELGNRTLAAISTPGHTQGHFVFADQEAGLLFSGDHVLPRITPSIGFEPAWVEQPLRDFLDSLIKVQQLPDMKVLPAHGPVTDSSHERIAELIDHHTVRLELCEQAVAAGARTAWEVAGLIPWTSRERQRDELNPFDATLAAFETLAHLDLLYLQGKLTRSGHETHEYAIAPAEPAAE